MSDDKESVKVLQDYVDHFDCGDGTSGKKNRENIKLAIQYIEDENRWLATEAALKKAVDADIGPGAFAIALALHTSLEFGYIVGASQSDFNDEAIDAIMKVIAIMPRKIMKAKQAEYIYKLMHGLGKKED